MAKANDVIFFKTRIYRNENITEEERKKIFDSWKRKNSLRCDYYIRKVYFLGELFDNLYPINPSTISQDTINSEVGKKEIEDIFLSIERAKLALKLRQSGLEEKDK